MRAPGRLLAVAATALGCLVPAVVVAPTAAAGAACSEFSTDVRGALQGSAAIWIFDSDCRIAEPTPITLRVLEAGRVIFERTWEQPNDLGRQWGQVPLAVKAPCTWSDVLVEASYDNRRGIADSTATQTRVWYEPEDNCGA